MPDGGWQLGVGDPTVVGWTTTGLYLVASSLAVRAARRLGAGQGPEELSASDSQLLARFWWLVFGIMLLLGVNKQIDLQTLFTQTAKQLAKAQGWYEARRRYQAAFVASAVLVVGAGVALLSYVLRGVLSRVLRPILGLFIVATYILLRAALFQHMDWGQLDRLEDWMWLLEVAGIALVLGSALRFGQPHAS